MSHHDVPLLEQLRQAHRFAGLYFLIQKDLDYPGLQQIDNDAISFIAATLSTSFIMLYLHTKQGLTMGTDKPCCSPQDTYSILCVRETSSRETDQG